MSEEKPKRKRTKREYAVLEIGANNFTLLTDQLQDTDDARRWIRDSGQAGARYRIVCLIGGPVQVQVEPVEKRSLVQEGNTDD